jgi:hypothetical protein
MPHRRGSTQKTMRISRYSRGRRSTARAFVSALQWAGVTIVSVFLLWSVAMVFWQALAR